MTSLVFFLLLHYYFPVCSQKSSELLSDTCSVYILRTIEREDYESVNITGKVEIFTPSSQM